MKNNVKIATFLICCFILITSCIKEDPKVDALITAPSSLIADATTTSLQFSLTTTREWKITTSTDWIASIDPSSSDNAVSNQTIEVTVSANTGDLRTGTITITSVDKTHEIMVSQAAAAPAVVLGQVFLMKATVVKESDGFNMLSDPGFEDYPNEDIGYFTPWWCADSFYTTENPHSGKRACGLDLNNISSNLGFQTLAAKPHTEYVITAYFKSNQDTGAPDTYLGIRKGSDRSVLKDVNKAPNFSTTWSRESVEFNTENQSLIEAFAFAFQKEGYVVYWDDVKVTRKDDKQDTYTLKNIVKVGSVFDELNGLTSSDGCIGWISGEGKTFLAFGECIGVGDAKTSYNALALSNNNNFQKDIASSLIKKDIVLPTAEGSCVPTAGVSVGNRQYIHYMESTDKAFAEPLWTVTKSGIAYSDDGGNNWKVTDVEWGPQDNFAQVALLKEDDYVYMYGTTAGRKIEEGEQYIKLARVPLEEMTTKSSWKYWNGNDWVDGVENGVYIVYGGTIGEISVTKDSVSGRYLMVYKSEKRNAVVVRDAANPQGDWSGEKLVYTETGEILSVPSIIGLSNNNELYFLISSAWGN